MAKPDPYEQMRMYAEFVTGMGERISALWLALRGAAEVDDEARGAPDPWDKQRLDGMRDGPVRDLLAKRAVRSDLTNDEAAAIFWVLTDPDAVPPKRRRSRPWARNWFPGLAATFQDPGTAWRRHRPPADLPLRGSCWNSSSATFREFRQLPRSEKSVGSAEASAHIPGIDSS